MKKRILLGIASVFLMFGMTGVAVRSGQVSAVPVPGAIWLLGSGLIGLVGFRRKIKK